MNEKTNEQTLDSMTAYVMARLLQDPPRLLTREGGADGTWVFDDGVPVADDVMTLLFRGGILTPLPLATEDGGEAETVIVTQAYTAYCATEMLTWLASQLVDDLLAPPTADRPSAVALRKQLAEFSTLVNKMYSAQEFPPNYRYGAKASTRHDAGMDWESGTDISWDVGREGE